MKLFKILFTLAGLLLLLQHAQSQVNCSITVNTDLPVCYGESVTLSVAEAENLIYYWQPDGQQTSSITIGVTAMYDIKVTVTDTITGEVCESATLAVGHHPQFEIQFEQMQLTCTNGDNDNGNTAMVRATALGESAPYVYSWDVRPTQIAPGNPSLAIGLKAHLWYFINVTDENNCIQTDSFFTKAYSNPVIEIIADPDTAYIQNPYVGFAFNNLSSDTVDVVSHFWEFGDGSPRSELETPVHLYTEIEEYKVLLTVYNQQGCDTVYFHDIKVLPIRLSIPNIITPNGDNINDVLIITEAPAESNDNGDRLKSAFSDGNFKPLNTYYKKTSLLIFNRQGRKVYESSNYNNDWGGEGLKDGVYFYVLQCEGYKSNDVYRGSITIMGSNN